MPTRNVPALRIKARPIATIAVDGEPDTYLRVYARIDGVLVASCLYGGTPVLEELLTEGAILDFLMAFGEGDGEHCAKLRRAIYEARDAWRAMVAEVVEHERRASEIPAEVLSSCTLVAMPGASA